jgi:hypothetical protein
MNSVIGECLVGNNVVGSRRREPIPTPLKCTQTQSSRLRGCYLSAPTMVIWLHFALRTLSAIVPGDDVCRDRILANKCPNLCRLQSLIVPCRSCVSSDGLSCFPIVLSYNPIGKGSKSDSVVPKTDSLVLKSVR